MASDPTATIGQPRKRRMVRLSDIQRLQIGAQCAEESRKTANERARQELHKRSKFASWINDELKVLKAKNFVEIPWRKAVKQHASRVAKLTRPNTKRFYSIPLKFNRDAIVKAVSKAWRRRGFRASEKTVYRCWREFQELERRISSEEERI